MGIERYKSVMRRRVEARPFRPFWIKLENGESYRITHPENVVWGKDGCTMVYTGNRFRAILEASAVSAIEGPRIDGADAK
jgi:hypothetical protein